MLTGLKAGDPVFWLGGKNNAQLLLRSYPAGYRPGPKPKAEVIAIKDRRP
jgi:hypothetical protein